MPAASSETTAATSDPATTADEATETTTTVSANDASVDELAAAFEATGIANARRWAREVEEYRPYPDDPTWARLRQELAKYNPGPGVVDQIVATLEP